MVDLLKIRTPFLFVFQVHNNIKYADEIQWNHVGSCILNGGGIRSPIDERNRNGTRN